MYCSLHDKAVEELDAEQAEEEDQPLKEEVENLLAVARTEKLLQEMTSLIESQGAGNADT